MKINNLKKQRKKNRLKKIRQEKNCLQVYLANIAEISIRTYQSYEASDSIPDVYTAQLLANALEEELQTVFPLQLALGAETESTKK